MSCHRKHFILRWVLLLAGIICSGDALVAQTKPVLTSRVKYYDINGENARDLRREMNRLRPVAATGPRTDAYTQWWIQWTARYRKVDNGAVIASLDTRIDVLHHLPRWTPATNAPPELVKLWTNYTKKLIAHEKAHQEIAVQAAQEFVRRVAEQSAFASTTAADEMVNNICTEVVRVYRAREVDYDRRTRHGETEGAKFP